MNIIRLEFFPSNGLCFLGLRRSLYSNWLGKDVLLAVLDIFT